MSWLEPFSTGKRTSLTWQHFKIHSEGTCMKCNYCGAVLTLPSRGTTSSMRYHLIAKHGDLEAVTQFVFAEKRAQRAKKRVSRPVKMCMSSVSSGSVTCY